MAATGTAKAASVAAELWSRSIGLRRSEFFAHVQLSRDRIVNHPGHSSQKSHGRKGGSATGGGGVRDALSGHGTAEEVSTAAAREAKRITGRDIEFDMAGTDPQIAAEHAEGVLRGLERYPDAPLERVEQRNLPDGLYGLTDETGTRILFSSHNGVEVDAYRHRLQRNEAVGDLVSGSPTGVALHEFGHVLEVRTKAASAAAKTAQDMASSKGADTQDYIGERVSNYGTESPHELTAEAFADVMSFGSDASPLSRAIVDEMDRLYAGGQS